MKALISKTPVRIAFGGGGTDVEPYSSDYGGLVVNSTINLYNRCFLKKRKDKSIIVRSNYDFESLKFDVDSLKTTFNKNFKLENLFKAIFYNLKPTFGVDVYIHSEVPKRAGLGSSASLSTSIIAGILKLEGKELLLSDIAEKAYYVEEKILKNEGGRQDQYSSVHGGFNSIEFKGGSDVKVRLMILSKSFKNDLKNNLILYYTGIPHVSGNLVEKQVQFYLKEEQRAKYFLDNLKDIAYKIHDALKEENLELFGKLLSEDFKIKKEFNPYLSNDYLDHIHQKVIKNGAIGGRIVGAGGGGCILWLIDPEKREKIINILKHEKGEILEFNFTNKGLRLIAV